ncbi:hypothetical protein D1O30_07685 [Methylocystis hirsuta]|uniref:Uncharacterized protein n=1 Tax=Methylocystis hirsuta TaxID=369798 RepID=A0A3M9XP21_9HYPH|nr:hypothetical protein D1O30_07685 [Methylocystis hirsuta]
MRCARARNAAHIALRPAERLDLLFKQLLYNARCFKQMIWMRMRPQFVSHIGFKTVFTNNVYSR